MLPTRLTVFVAGMIAANPNLGGATWAVLQYVLGLRRLGHDVVFVEPVPRADLRPAGVPLAATDNAAYFRRVAGRFGFEGSAALLLEDDRQTFGMTYETVREKARAADLLLNVSGMLTDPALFEPIPSRAYLDLDPGFIQSWASGLGIDMRFDGHTHFVTVGLSVGEPGCPVPDCGRAWRKTLPPVVLDEWPEAREPPVDAFTTVAHWRGYGSFEHAGIFYGQKAHSLRRLLDLPSRAGEAFTLALSIHPDERPDLEALADHGWRLVDPSTVASTPDDYRRFVRGSKAEFGVAKLGYVNARTGWFSDRSACYLASGRPVIAQDTGFGERLGAMGGVFPFAGAEDVLTAVEALRADYRAHARAARETAADVFDSDRVLTRLIETVSA